MTWRLRRLAAALALWCPVPLAAQGIGVGIGHFFEGTGWTTYRVGVTRGLPGPLELTLYGTALRSAATLDRRLWGAGADLSLFRDGHGPFLIGGVSGGLGTGAARTLWGAWSAGGGYELSPLPWLVVSGEGRWRRLTPESRHGFELGVGLRLRFGGIRPGPPRRGAPVPIGPLASAADSLKAAGPPGGAASPGDSGGIAPPSLPATWHGRALVTRADSVVATAGDEMGRRYQLGGRGEGKDGFDCSGLIQFAYGRHGIKLPRRSADQAREGHPVTRSLDALRVGDILTFSNGGHGVTHVGLYVGDGKFIHSATHGVQESRLRDDDPYGRWWFQRWVGARRVME